jgi:hypothetical protein
MHWDLGRMNMPSWSPQYLDADGYLKKFAAQLQKYSQCGGARALEPFCIRGPKGKALFECKKRKKDTRELLKLCISAGAADIAGGSPSRDFARLSKVAKADQLKGFVSDADNAALQLCNNVHLKELSRFGGLKGPALALIDEICSTDCVGKDCALTALYPGKDIWTLYGFGDKGLGYRKRLLDRFDELASTRASYHAWCDTTLSDLPESPKIFYSPLFFVKEDHANSERLTVYLQAHQLTGKEQSSCHRLGETGYISGLCLQDNNGQCKSFENIDLPCAPPMRLKALGANARASLNLSAKVNTMAFIYHNSLPLFHFGGVAWMHHSDRGDEIVQIDGLHGQQPGIISNRQLWLGKPRKASDRSYNAFRDQLDSGLDVSDVNMQVVPDLAVDAARYAFAVTLDTPHGGLAFLKYQPIVD